MSISIQKTAVSRTDETAPDPVPVHIAIIDKISAIIDKATPRRFGTLYPSKEVLTTYQTADGTARPVPAKKQGGKKNE